MINKIQARRKVLPFPAPVIYRVCDSDLMDIRVCRKLRIQSLEYHSAEAADQSARNQI